MGTGVTVMRHRLLFPRLTQTRQLRPSCIGSTGTIVRIDGNEIQTMTKSRGDVATLHIPAAAERVRVVLHSSSRDCPIHHIKHGSCE
jgi:hypothetical protein